MTNQITEELVYWGRAEPPNGDDSLVETESETEVEPPGATEDEVSEETDSEVEFETPGMIDD